MIESVFSEQARGLTDIIWHPVAAEYLKSEAMTRVIIKGNQGGGTRAAMQDAACRLLGVHPVSKRNKIEVPIRCISKCLPKNDEDEENQQYVEFKRLFPTDYIKRDITSRSPHMILRDPGGGADKKIEFLSKKQDVDAFMSVQRASIYQDEEIEKIKWDENQSRLAIPASRGKGGDTSLVLTPVKGLDWTYDSIWCRACKIFRSDCVRAFLKNEFNVKVPAVEIFKENAVRDIEIFSWATDDNPMVDGAAIDRLFGSLDEQHEKDELAMRRYGVFRQATGRIYKTFDTGIHVIPWDKHWQADTFRYYWHYRIIDYHPAKPWYISWVAVTPTHEWFVWHELTAYHDNLTSHDLKFKIQELSLLDEEDEYNRGVEIDPLAKVKQSNSGFSVFDDLSRGPDGLKGCRAAITTARDEHGNEHGRMNVRTRLKNSLRAGVPGNNLIKNMDPDIRFGNYLPTIWFFDCCTGHIKHFNTWRTVRWKQEATRAVKNIEKPAQKWSDFCRNIEFLGARNPVFYDLDKQHDEWDGKRFFQGQRRAA